MTAAGYPPEPWRLRGDFVVSVFLVPRRDLPPAVAAHAPVGARPVTVAGRAVVGVAGVRYTADGQLAYDELLVALPVWRGRGRVAVTIPWIRVTTAVSRDGGRALWAIPKELMQVSQRVAGDRWVARWRDLEPGQPSGLGGGAGVSGGASAGAVGEAGLFASLDAVPARWRLPCRLTVPLPTAQRLEGREVLSHNVVRGVIAPVRARWRFSGPLGWLAARRSVASVTIARADVVFGLRSSVGQRHEVHRNAPSSH